MPICFKTRYDWFAKPPHVQIPMQPGPVSYVIFTYTRKEYRHGKQSPGPRPGSDEIISELLYVQRGDMHKYSDIRYNFLIGPDGCVYEGRGWISVPTLPIKITNLTFKSLYVGFIGDYTEEPPPKALFEARDQLLKFGVENQFIQKKFSSVILRLPMHFKCQRNEYWP